MAFISQIKLSDTTYDISAVKLKNARTISLTGSVTGSGTFDGSGNLSIATTTNHSHNYAGSSSAGGVATSSYSLQNKGTLDTQEKIDNFLTANQVTYATFKTADSNNIGMESNDGMILSLPWTSTSYGAQIAFDDYTSGIIKVRGKSSSWGSWYTLLHSGNYTSYTVQKDGTGASGTWGISISGNAATASSIAWSNVSGKPSTYTPSSHTHDDRYYTESEINSKLSGKSDTGHTHSYAGSSSAGGAANSVKTNLIIKLNSGTTEGTNLFTFNGSAAKTINITPASIGASASGHTHNYAGSASAGGSANSAVKLDTATAGDSNTPVYFSGGKPVACTSLDLNTSGNAATASKVNNKLTVGSKSYDGSSAVTITASDLGLASAMLFLGTTTTAISDGATKNPVTIGGANKTVTAGNVVLYGSKEFVWTGSAWEELGNEGSYKIVQAAVADPSASGTSNTFIATISQDANGKITATKKTVAVTNSAPTLSWGATSTIGSVAGTNLQVKMPANPNTDTKVTQTVTTSNAAYPLLLAPSGQTATTTTTSYFDSGVTLNPSTNTIAANISGNAATASSVAWGNVSGKPSSYTPSSHTHDQYLPLTAGESKKLTGPLGLTKNVNYGTSLPSTGFTGQLFFLESDGDSDGPSLPTGGTAGQVLVKNSSTDGDASWATNISGNAATATKATQDGNGNVISSTYLKLSGGTMTGQIKSSYSTGGGWINGRDRATIRNTVSTSGSSFAPIVSSKTQLGSWDLGPCHPDESFYFSYATDANYNAGTNSTTTTVHIRSNGTIYGAVWNDYAEFRICNEDFKPGQVVLENGDDTLSIASQRLQRGCSIVSDTFGFAIGETDEAKCPIAVSGRVLAYGYESREEFKKHIGWPVCSGPNGTVSIMTEEEEEKYPSRIIGTISAIPDYETWGAGNVPVNGRIWIKVK